MFDKRFRTIERVFAWEDKFWRLLLRFERLSPVHYAFKALAYTIFITRTASARSRHIASLPPACARVKPATIWMGSLPTDGAHHESPYNYSK